MGTLQHHSGQVGRILLALQFWEGDRARAGELARFITDLERVPHPRADFLLSARFDSTPDPEVVKYVGRRFNVFTAIGSTQLTGHPAGSFGLWHDTLVAVRERARADSRYACAFVFEADCVPLAREWIDELLADGLAHPGAAVAGHEWHGSNCPFPHINGNMLISCRLPKLDALIQWRGSPARAWDVEGYRAFLALGGRNTPVIRSLYVKDTPPTFLGRLRSIGASVLHGDKDGSALAVSKRYVLRGEPFPTTDDPVRAFSTPEDAVPSVFEQLPGRALDFGGVPARRYNPSLLRDGDGWLAAYRRVGISSWDSSLWVARLNAGFECQSQREIGGLSPWPDGRTAYYEDPRLVRIGGRVLLSYTRGAYGGFHPKTNKPLQSWVQCAGWLSEDGSRVVEHLALKFGRNDEHNVAAVERDWVFFDPERKAEPQFIYDIVPFTTVRVSDMRARTYRHVPQGKWVEKWGAPRAGTPPVQIPDGKWVTFFHSWTPHRTRERRFHVGAVEFEVGRLRTKIHRFTQVPLVTASERDGFLWPSGACFWEPVVVKPCGADFHAGVWTVSAGINDAHSAVFQFSADLLSDAFQRKPEPR